MRQCCVSLLADFSVEFRGDATKYDLALLQRKAIFHQSAFDHTLPCHAGSAICCAWQSSTL
jgi:hypothetical protein